MLTGEKILEVLATESVQFILYGVRERGSGNGTNKTTPGLKKLEVGFALALLIVPCS